MGSIFPVSAVVSIRSRVTVCVCVCVCACARGVSQAPGFHIVPQTHKSPQPIVPKEESYSPSCKGHKSSRNARKTTSPPPHVLSLYS